MTVVLFIITLLLLLAVKILPAHGLIPAVSAGLAVIAMIISCLFSAVPLTEILLLLLVLVFICCLPSRKGGKS